MRECENEGDGLHWLWEMAEEWAQDGKLGQNGNDLMILIIVFHWGTFMSGCDVLLVFFPVICL